VIDFTSSNHLGLCKHPQVIAKSRECLEKYGAGSGGSRLLAGNLPIFLELEQKIAKEKRTESSIIFNSAYQANASVIPALLDIKLSRPVVFTDRLVHASIHVGIQEAGIDQIRYRHLDMNHLEDSLKKYEFAAEKFIFSETVFGMDGDAVDLSHITFLAEKYGAFLYLDDAHGLGMYGKNGYGAQIENGITIGAFSKTLGSCGGFVSCSNILQSYLINKSKNFIYSTSLPPAVIGANLAAWDLLPIFEKERNLIAKNAVLLREKLHANGFNTGNSSTHIIPIIIGSAKETLSAAAYLKENGILVSAIRPPSVPPNTSRLRVSISAHHKTTDIERFVQLLITHRRTSLYNPDISREKDLFS
jgi:8-amino-7-oxononanoate synthase